MEKDLKKLGKRGKAIADARRAEMEARHAQELAAVEGAPEAGADTAVDSVEAGAGTGAGAGSEAVAGAGAEAGAGAGGKKKKKSKAQRRRVSGVCSPLHRRHASCHEAVTAVAMRLTAVSSRLVLVPPPPPSLSLR